MSFNIRFFTIEMLYNAYNEDPENGIGNAIGKTDGFTFDRGQTAMIIQLWQSGQKQAAINLLEEYVRGIAIQDSTNN